MMEMITKWLRISGLRVNNTKTELCLFHWKDHQAVVINEIIKSKLSMGVPGIIFDSKMQWHPQIQNGINQKQKSP